MEAADRLARHTGHPTKQTALATTKMLAAERFAIDDGTKRPNFTHLARGVDVRDGIAAHRVLSYSINPWTRVDKNQHYVKLYIFAFHRGSCFLHVRKKQIRAPPPPSPMSNTATTPLAPIARDIAPPPCDPETRRAALRSKLTALKKHRTGQSYHEACQMRDTYFGKKRVTPDALRQLYQTLNNKPAP
jgi:hypothetical protein